MNSGDRVRKSIRFAWPDMFVLNKEWLAGDDPPDRACVAVATYLPLRGYKHMPAFIKQSSAVESQLRSTPGLLRYGVRVSLLRKRFWTYSLWEERAAIDGFIQEDAHLDAVRRFPQWAGDEAKFTAFETSRAELSWAEILRRLDGPGIGVGQLGET